MFVGSASYHGCMSAGCSLPNGMHGESVRAFRLMGCLLSDVIGWKDEGRVKKRRKRVFFGRQGEMTCAPYIMRAYGAHTVRQKQAEHHSAALLHSSTEPVCLSHSLSAPAVPPPSFSLTLYSSVWLTQ